MGKVVDVSLETASADTISDGLSHLFVSPISQELATITKESFRDLTVALVAILRVPFVSLGNEWSSLFSQSRTPTSEVLPKHACDGSVTHPSGLQFPLHSPSTSES